MTDRYDAAVVLNYYRPYVSGLTETAAIVAEGLAARGWRVAAVAAQHDPELARVETIAGVEVHRAPVALRIGKGVISPSFFGLARHIMRQSTVVNMHLPMLEAVALAKLRGPAPLASTYHCDVNLHDRFVDPLVVRTVDASSRGALRRSNAVIVSSMDYARSSRVADALPARCEEIPPPCAARTPGLPTFRDGDGPHIGFLGRIVAEKGLDVLVRAFRLGGDPRARLLVAGDYGNVAGGSVIDAVREAAGDDQRIRFLGFLPEQFLADFYASLDVFVLPSVNSLEAFGIVQVEAMLAGVPVVASDLPGVRVPVRTTGMGRLVPPRDAAALASAIDAVLTRKAADELPEPVDVAAYFSAERTIDAYEEVLRGLASA